MTAAHHIRPRTTADRAGCFEVFFRAVREGAASRYTAAERAAWAPNDRFDPTAEDRFEGMPGWVAVDANGQVVGFLIVSDEGYLDMLFVLPEQMGHDTAAALYDRLIEWAGKRALPRLTSHASLFARPFLEKRGWQVLEQEEKPLNGERLLRFHMALDLEEGNHERPL